MVVLGVVFENLSLFLVVEVADEIVEVEIFAPFLTVHEPVFVLVDESVEVLRRHTSSRKVPHRTCGLAEIATGKYCQPRNQIGRILEMYESQGVQTLSITGLLELGSQLEDLGILLWGRVARVTALLVWGSGREVVVIVLGIKLHGGVLGRHGGRMMDLEFARMENVELTRKEESCQPSGSEGQLRLNDVGSISAISGATN